MKSLINGDKTMRIIAVANQKGGSGKTTTSINLSAALVERGYKVLLVDMDPQFNCTTGVGIEVQEGQKTVYDLLLDENHADVIQQTDFSGLDIIPASLHLAGAELQLPQIVGSEYLLREALEPIKGYDYIFIDCPPSLGRLTLCSLSAATDLLVPIQMGKWALMGTNQLFETVELVRQRINPNLNIIGVLCTMYDSRTNLSKEIHAALKERFGELMFQTVIRMATKIGESAVADIPLIFYNSRSNAARQYRKLADEIEKR